MLMIPFVVDIHIVPSLSSATAQVTFDGIPFSMVMLLNLILSLLNSGSVRQTPPPSVVTHIRLLLSSKNEVISLDVSPLLASSASYRATILKS